MLVDVLAAAIGVVQQARGRPAPLQRLFESCQPQENMQGRRTRPADRPSTPQIEDRGQIQPAFPGSEVGDVGHPTWVGPVGAGRRGRRLAGTAWPRSLVVVRGRRRRQVAERGFLWTI